MFTIHSLNLHRPDSILITIRSQHKGEGYGQIFEEIRYIKSSIENRC